MKKVGAPSRRRRAIVSGQSVTFLVSQVGALSSRQWNERLRQAGLDSRLVMLFWNVATGEGRSQRELADALRLPASRIVDLADGLERKGWLERRLRSGDRRAYQLYLTATGRSLLENVMAIAEDHEDDFTSGLKPAERAELVRLLNKVAVARGLLPQVHPDF